VTFCVSLLDGEMVHSKFSPPFSAPLVERPMPVSLSTIAPAAPSTESVRRSLLKIR